MCILFSGLLVNLYLAIVARTLTAADYAHFGAFWSVALLVGFGVFLPIEQETARLLQTPGRPGRILRSALLIALAMAVGELLVLALASPLLLRAFGGEPATVAALGVLCLISAGQFVVRGALIGLDRLHYHAALMLVDSGLRVTLAATVALAVSGPDVATFAWTLVAAIALAHAPTLLRLMVRKVRPGNVPPFGPGVVTPSTVTAATAPLLLGSLCGQALLNGPPVLVPALAQGPAEATLAGQFVAAFTLARIPLFLVVPLQTALLPVLTGLLHTGDRNTLRRVVGKLGVGVGGLAVLGALIGLLAGPLLIRLIFGSRYVLSGVDVALLSVGVAAYIGLVVMTQVLVAAGRHRQVGLSWVTGLTAATCVVLAVPELLLRAELGFIVGAGVAWLTSTFGVFVPQRRRELLDVC
jgi:O-antigen/teichoic acid export membrane protein